MTASVRALAALFAGFLDPLDLARTGLLTGLDRAGQRAMVSGINRLIAGWYGCPRPVVTAVNGHAIAGGLFLALCGDWRVGTTQGRYGLTEARVGVPYPAVVLAVARAELPPPVLRRLVLRAHLLDAGEAEREGLWDEVTPPDEVLGRALERRRGQGSRRRAIAPRLQVAEANARTARRTCQCRCTGTRAAGRRRPLAGWR